jgi:NADH-quinone oxidoreductase subunit K
MIISINYVLIIFGILFFIGILGLVLNRKNIIITLMSLELMLLAVNLNFIIFSVYLDDIVGQIFVLFILTIAATESSIGLALLMVYFKLKNSIHMEKIRKSKK